jgi:dUTP pyrophosphatase
VNATVEVLVVRLDKDLPLPAYAHPGDAGMDLRAAADAVVPPAGGRVTVGTGLSLALPDGFVGLVHPRSGLAARHGLTVANAPGTVDAGYRGEIRVTLLNTDPRREFRVRRGDRIAQLLVQRVEAALLIEVERLPGSVRGDGGFGSTGLREE